jgi:integrase/recombinase XerD
MQNAILEYLEYLQNEQGSSKNTILAYRSDLAQFRERISQSLGPNPSPSMLSEEHCTQYIEWLGEREYRPSTIYRKVAAVRSFFDFLGERGDLATTSIRESMAYSSTAREVPLVLSREEVSRLVVSPLTTNTPLAKRDHAILSLMYATGLGASNVVALKTSEVDLELGYFNSLGAPMTLGDSAAPMKRYLEEGRPHLSRDPAEMAVFLNQRGKGLTRQGLWLIVKRWAASAQIDTKISPHTLRHSLVRHLLEKGLSVKKVQMKLGMKSPNSIRIFNTSNREERIT